MSTAKIRRFFNDGWAAHVLLSPPRAREEFEGNLFAFSNFPAHFKDKVRGRLVALARTFWICSGERRDKTSPKRPPFS